MNVVAYSFFRSEFSCYEQDNCGAAKGRFFVNFLPAVIRAHQYVWHGWELWIFHDNRVTEYPYWNAVSRMEQAGLLKLFPFGPSKSLTGIGGMIERMNPIFNWDVDYLVCRDVDSLPMPRDRKMVEEFIGRQATAHAIQDSISHSGLMGGTCAWDARKFRQRFECKSLPELLDRGAGLHIDYNRHGGDQLFLNGYVVPNVATDLVIHTKRAYLNELCKTRLDVIPQQCEEDRLSNHVGGVYDAERAARFYDQHHPNEAILQAERIFVQ